MSITALGDIGIAVALLLRVGLLWRAPGYGFDRFQHLGLASPRRVTWITGSVAQRYALDRGAAAPTDYPPLATLLLSVLRAPAGRRWASRWGGVTSDAVFAIGCLALGAPAVLVALVVFQPLLIEEGLGYGARPLADLALLPFAAVVTGHVGWDLRAVTVGACVLVVMYLHRFTSQALVVACLAAAACGQVEVAAAFVAAMLLGLAVPFGGYRLILSEQRRYWRVLDSRMRRGEASVVGLPGEASISRWAVRELARGAYLVPAALVIGWQARGCGPWVTTGVIGAFIAVAVVPTLRRYGEAARYLKVALVLGLFAPLSLGTYAAAAGLTVVALIRWLPQQRRQIREGDAATSELSELLRLVDTTDRVIGTWPVASCLPLFALVDGPIYTHISYKLADEAAVLATGSLQKFADAARRAGVGVLLVHDAPSAPTGWSGRATCGRWSVLEAEDDVPRVP